MSEEIKQDLKESEESIELSVDDLEAILASGTDTPINIAELLETEMVRSRTLYLNEEVSIETVTHVIQLIHHWNRLDEGLSSEERQSITIYIDSPGGEVTKGLSLVSAIENSKTEIVGIVQGGTAMSMGLIIFLACHVRIISRHSDFLYHEIRSGSETATLREQQNTIRWYERLQNRIDEYIVERTDVPMNLLKQKRSQNLDWYIDIKDLQKYNFAHIYN